VPTAGVLIFLACFSLFNVAFRRALALAGLFFVWSFIAMFVVRIAFGP
jgi:hypothetical protein